MENKSFEEIFAGDSSSFTHVVREEDIKKFAEVSGDINPLHIDEEYAGKMKFGGRIVHGMFLAALVSRLAGVYLPGKRCLLLSLALVFKAPARIGDTVEVKGTVAAKSEATKIIDITVEIRSQKKLLAEGNVKTQVL